MGNACRQRAGCGAETLNRAETRKSKTESAMYEHIFTLMGIRCADGSKGRRGGTSCRTFEFSFRSVFHRWLKNLRFAEPPLARTTGAYAFWIDADDVVDPPEREKSRQLLEGLRSDGAGRGAAEAAAYVVRCGAILGRVGIAGRRWWILSGSFRCDHRILEAEPPERPDWPTTLGSCAEGLRRSRHNGTRS